MVTQADETSDNNVNGGDVIRRETRQRREDNGGPLDAVEVQENESGEFGNWGPAQEQASAGHLKKRNRTDHEREQAPAASAARCLAG